MSLDDEREERILEKAAYVEDAVAVLKRKQSLGADEYYDDREQRDVVEREFQTAIEACLDIAALLCRDLEGTVPVENAEKFVVLARQGVLSAETAERMKDRGVPEHPRPQVRWGNRRRGGVPDPAVRPRLVPPISPGHPGLHHATLTTPARKPGSRSAGHFGSSGLVAVSRR